MIIKSSDSLSQFQLSPRLVKLNDGVIHITRHVSLYAGGWLAFCHLSFLPNELKRVGRSGFVTALVACFWRYGWWMMVRSFFWMFYKTSQSEYWIMTHDLMLFTFFLVWWIIIASAFLGVSSRVSIFLAKNRKNSFNDANGGTDHGVPNVGNYHERIALEEGEHLWFMMFVYCINYMYM